MSDHRGEAKDIPKAHLDDPAGTGCIWRWTRDSHNALCCDHMKQSYDACQGRAPYQSDEYLARWQGTRLRRKVYEDVADRKDARAAAIRDGAEPEASAKLREWAANFDRDAWLEKKLAMLGDAFHRLKVKESGAWKVGATVDLAGLSATEKARYFGRMSATTAKPNHLPKRTGGLGFWYPYDHNHHHIIPISSVEAILTPAPEKKGTKEDRVEIMMLSKWNINGGGNVMILPLDVNVSRIVQLPAHCPWGGNHRPYLEQVKQRLSEVRDVLDGACEEQEKDKKHDARKAAAAEVEPLLTAASKALYDDILRKAGGRPLGKV